MNGGSTWLKNWLSMPFDFVTLELNFSPQLLAGAWM